MVRFRSGKVDYGQPVPGGLNSTMVRFRSMDNALALSPNMESQFHYGSIQIDTADAGQNRTGGLNSTMVRFRLYTSHMDILFVESVSIPLWFDSDVMYHHLFLSVPSSQFHYGSIQIIQYLRNRMEGRLSQFHYGSIQMEFR